MDLAKLGIQNHIQKRIGKKLSEFESFAKHNQEQRNLLFLSSPALK